MCTRTSSTFAERLAVFGIGVVVDVVDVGFAVRAGED
jgi:hypothetical protein